ncbi:MarR family transcriptional regulator [Bacillus sp. BRMEA1]|uniref:MarR family winged helix-turn-helix transcriptional regulator n=1 Tax=Neobacillus endophyticus TaxID=2738405 RepID=UPI0015664C0F|nr:MarR family transcriptional regulator [Neobacillus endophyticus]NRD76355.1 MarR family transcriptional regulator [Neobacillus endophyticus]
MEFSNHPEPSNDVTKNLRKLSTRMVLFQQKAAQSIGLVVTDFKTADILNENGPLTAGELGNITGLSTGSVTALIDRLEHAGFVKRERDPNDRRRVMIIPVKEKLKNIKEHYTSLNDQMIKLCAQYTEKELSLIIGFIEKTIAIHEKEIRGTGKEETE